MKTRVIIAAGLLGLALPQTAFAQAAERGARYWAERIAVAPSDAAAYRTAISKVAKAVADVGYEDFRWSFYEDAYTFTLLYPSAKDESDAYLSYGVVPEELLEAIERLSEQLKGTPGAQTLGEAQRALDDVQILSSEAGLWQQVPEWDYVPAGVEVETKYAHVDQFWVKPGKEAEFRAAMAEIFALAESLGYSYALEGFRILYGDKGRYAVRTHYGDKSEYYGARRFEALVKEKGAGERVGQMMGRIERTIVRMEHRDIEFRPAMSYWPR